MQEKKRKTVTLKVSLVAGAFWSWWNQAHQLESVLSHGERNTLDGVELFFFPLLCSFMSLYISPAAVTRYVWVSEGVLPSPCLKLATKTQERQHLMTAHPKVCGRRSRNDTKHFSETSKWGSRGKRWCVSSFLMSTHCCLISRALDFYLFL